MNKLNLNTILFGTLLFTAFILKGQESITPPNFIFYLADDQDQLDYGAYGNPKVHTPAVRSTRERRNEIH